MTMYRHFIILNLILIKLKESIYILCNAYYLLIFCVSLNFIHKNP